MNIELHFTGNSIVEIECSNNSNIIMSTITDLNGKIDEDFIIDLQEVVNLMIEHNERQTNLYKPIQATGGHTNK